MSQLTTLNVARKQSVVFVSLSRPEVHNAFSEAMITELTDEFTELSKDESIRVIVLQGSGKSFCAGADLDYMRQAAALDYAANREAALQLAEMYRAIYDCPIPILGIVHGAAMGGGIGLCSVCDVVVAAESTKFSLSEVRLGIIPAVIGPYTIGKIGYSNFLALGVTGERFDARTALQIGLVHEVVANELLDVAAQQKLELFLQGSAAAQRLMKKYARTLLPVAPQDYANTAATAIATARMSPDGKEGITAFLEKRQPIWVEKPE